MEYFLSPSIFGIYAFPSGSNSHIVGKSVVNFKKEKTMFWVHKSFFLPLLSALLSYTLFGYDKELFTAIENGDVRLVKKIIEKDHKKNYEYNDCGMAPLHFAARKGRLEIVKYLIEIAGVDKEARTSYRGETPLLVAAAYSQIPVVRYLVEKGCNVHAKTNPCSFLLFTLTRDNQSSEIIVNAPAEYDDGHSWDGVHAPLDFVIVQEVLCELQKNKTQDKKWF